MKFLEGYGSLAGRAALGSIFIASGFGKLAGLEGTASLLASMGLPESITLAMALGVTELVGGLMLFAGLRTRAAALALAFTLVPATFLFHNPFGVAGEDAHLRHAHALQNLAIAAGLVTVATWGAGPLSLDAERDRWRRSLESAI